MCAAEAGHRAGGSSAVSCLCTQACAPGSERSLASHCNPSLLWSHRRWQNTAHQGIATHAIFYNLEVLPQMAVYIGHSVHAVQHTRSLSQDQLTGHNWQAFIVGLCACERSEQQQGIDSLIQVLTEQYFGSADAMLRLDMSEYMERHSVAKLIGAPPGKRPISCISTCSCSKCRTAPAPSALRCPLGNSMRLY